MWRKYPATLRERHSAAAATLTRNGDARCVVVAGGRDANNKHLIDAEMYDIAMNEWSPLPSMHSERFGCAAVALNDTMVVVGGQRNHTILGSAEYWTYGTPQWKRLNSMETPRAFCAAVSLSEHNMIVVMGGRDDTLSSVSSVVAFDTKQKQWKDLAPMNEPRMGCSAVLLGSSKILVVGGFDGKRWLDSAEVYSFDDNSWEVLPAPLPTCCGFSAAVVTSDEKMVVVIGGRNESERLDQVQCYNLETEKWITLASEDGGTRDGSCAATFRDTILVVGGSDGPDFSIPPSTSCQGLHLSNTHRDELRSLSGTAPGEDATCKTPRGIQVFGPGNREGSVIRAVAVPVHEDQESSVLTEDYRGASHNDQLSQSERVTHRFRNAAALVYKNTSYIENILLFQNGQRSRYSGDIDSKNRPHGKGHITYDSDHSIYDGDWWHGAREGFGKATYANTDVYEGSFHKDQRHGEGTLQWRDGRQYEGYFSEDRKCGPGKLTWKNGTQYEGEFREGRPGGVGKLQFPCGTLHEGFFAHGKFDGLGICMYSDGRIYRGEFKGGKSHGFGRLSQKGGVLVHVGRFRDDEAVLESEKSEV